MRGERAQGPGRGRYELLCHLATGGMANLSLARASGPGRFEKLLAIKTLPRQYAANPQSVALFLDEARIAATLHHTNIAQVFDVGHEQDEIFLAMEFLFGQDVAAIQRRVQEGGSRLGDDQAIAIVLGMCAGLHHAHERGIVHRDVSPHNVIVTYDGGVKVIDFGIAKAADRLTRTETGVLRGKLGYMSPEQARCEPLDHRSDVYAIGIVLAELTTGRRLFAEDNDYRRLQQVASGAFERPFDHRPGYPAELERIASRALAADRDQRTPTARELLDDLEAYARRAGLDVSQHALARTMEQLFDDDLDGWRDMQQAGGSLARYIAETRGSETLVSIDAAPSTDGDALGGRPTLTMLPVDTAATVPMRGGTRRPKRTVAAVIAGAIALATVIAIVALRATGAPEAPAAPPKAAKAPATKMETPSAAATTRAAGPAPAAVVQAPAVIAPTPSVERSSRPSRTSPRKRKRARRPATEPARVFDPEAPLPH